MKGLFNNRRPGFWLLLVGILVVALLFSEQLLQEPDSDAANDDPFVYAGPSSLQLGEQYFVVENPPQTYQEEVVYLYFLSAVQKDFDTMETILAPTMDHQVSLEHLRQQSDDGLYTSYILHQFSTLDLDRINRPSAGYQYDFYNLDASVLQHKLVDYQVINVVYTQEHCAELSALGPQWGDGTLSRNYLVGKSDSDDPYRIYDFAIPFYVTD